MAQIFVDIHTHALVAHDELYPVQTASFQPFEEIDPAGFMLVLWQTPLAYALSEAMTNFRNEFRIVFMMIQITGFVFDEAEYLAYGNGTKIDVLRQIYDETSVPIIICGTYVLKDLISGERKKKVSQTHNRPQIFRRLRKEEFDRIDEHEVNDYLTLLETQYMLRLDSAVKTSLIANCRDRQSGGLGNFIEILELLFSQVRPEWETISYQMIRETGRTLHHHTEPVQSYTSIKPTKFDDHEIKDFEEQKRSTNSSVQSRPENSIDISTLSPVRVDMKMLQDVLRHKMGM